MTNYEVGSTVRFFEKKKGNIPDLCFEVVYGRYKRVQTTPIKDDDDEDNDDDLELEYRYEYYDNIYDDNEFEDYSAEFYGFPIILNEKGEYEVASQDIKIDTYRALSIHLVRMSDIKPEKFNSPKWESPKERRARLKALKESKKDVL